MPVNAASNDSAALAARAAWLLDNATPIIAAISLCPAGTVTVVKHTPSGDGVGR